MNTKSYTVHIFGQEYTVVSDEAETDIVQAAGLVHEIMETVAMQTTGMNKQKVAVLAALQLAHDLVRAQKDVEQRKQQEDALVSFIDHKIASL